jgi:hypothetical protein
MLRIITILLLALAAGTAEAYVGPGAGISVLGSLLGILATILVAIGAIVFWPIRKLMKRRKSAAAAAQSMESATESSASDRTPQS